MLQVNCFRRQIRHGGNELQTQMFEQKFTESMISYHLLIKKATRHDERTFLCLAKNKVGEAQQSVNLIVEYKPRFVMMSQNSEEVYFSWALDDKNRSSFVNQKFT